MRHLLARKRHSPSGLTRAVRMTRSVVAGLLVLAGILPYAAPAVCSATSMPPATHEDMGRNGASGSSVQQEADGMSQCDFSACAVAPAAPPMAGATLTTGFTLLWLAAVGPVLEPGLSTAPLTPPPLS